MKLMDPDYRGRTVPDLFTCSDGTPVTSKEVWGKMVEAFLFPSRIK